MFNVILEVFDGKRGVIRTERVLKSFEDRNEAENYVLFLGYDEALELAGITTPRRYTASFKADDGDYFSIIFKNDDSVDVYVHEVKEES